MRRNETKNIAIIQNGEIWAAIVAMEDIHCVSLGFYICSVLMIALSIP